MRCFTFQDYQLAPTLEEYTHLLCISSLVMFHLFESLLSLTMRPLLRFFIWALVMWRGSGDKTKLHVDFLVEKAKEMAVVPQNFLSHILQCFDKHHLNLLKSTQGLHSLNHPPKPFKIRVLVPARKLRFSRAQSSPICSYTLSSTYMSSFKAHKVRLNLVDAL